MNNIRLDSYLSHLKLHHAIQPIIELPTNEVFGYEMLLRSNGVESPQHIFDYAEKQNKLFDLDMYSIMKAFDTLNKRESTLGGLHFFINILPSTMSNSASIRTLQKLQSSSKSTAHHIVFEITEERKEEELMM